MKAAKWKGWFLILLGAIAAAFLFGGKAPDSGQAVKVILGEAANQSFIGKIAVGEVIRNRGSLEGFSSTQKDLDAFYRQQPMKARRAAQAAWILSHLTNFTGHADHFDNVKEFGVPQWTATMRKTVKIDDMQYYRSKQ